VTGLLATITRTGIATAQDGGRPGFTDVGVPVAGAWHRARYERACALLCGVVDGSTPTIEVLAGEMDLRAATDLVLVVTGPAQVSIDGRRTAVGAVVRVPAGAGVTVIPDGVGPVYVAVSGWRPDRTLASCSVDTFSHLGGAAFTVGDPLLGDAAELPEDRVGWFHRPVRPPSGPLRIVVTDVDRAETFLARPWVVRRMARSGVRLRSTGWLAPTESVDSFPVVPGAIQLTPDAEAIVLGPDGALTGGYPVVGVVASVDLDRISTLSAGAEITFVAIEATAAVKSWATAENERSRSLAHPSMLA